MRRAPSKNVDRGLSLLCGYIEDALNPDQGADPDFTRCVNESPDVRFKRRQWEGCIKPALDWIYKQRAQCNSRPAKPVKREERGAYGMPQRRILEVTKLASGWSLHLACGHKVTRERVVCRKCWIRKRAAGSTVA